MTLKKILVALVILSLVAAPAFAKPRPITPSVAHPTHVDRITEEVTDSVVDILVGEDGKPVKSSKGTPPGLAKKGKTPPGHAKGNKTGWDQAPKESPIKTFIKGLFGRK